MNRLSRLRLPRNEAIDKLLQTRDLTGAIDLALSVSAKRITQRVEKLRANNPHATPAELIDIVGVHFTRHSGTTSSAVGAGATVPGVGTGVAFALTSAQLAAFLAASGYYVLTVAEIHNISADQIEERRALFLSSVLGPQAPEMISNKLELRTIHWAKSQVGSLSAASLGAINEFLMKKLSSLFVKRLGGKALGRLAPFGIGAIIGWFGGRKMAHSVIEGAAATFGPAPESFASPRLGHNVDIEHDIVDDTDVQIETVK